MIGYARPGISGLPGRLASRKFSVRMLAPIYGSPGALWQPHCFDTAILTKPVSCGARYAVAMLN
jgi:hypothetical protein